jgi:hypothetical protein
MAQYTLTGTFGTSFENNDTILLTVSSGTISPTSTTKSALAAGLTVTVDDGVTITAVANTGTCVNVLATTTAGTPPVVPDAPGAGSYDCNSRTWATASWDSGTGAVTLTPSANTTIHSYEPTNIDANSGIVYVSYVFSNSETEWDNTDEQITCDGNNALDINTGDTLDPFTCTLAGFYVNDGIVGETVTGGVTSGSIFGSITPSTYQEGLTTYYATITAPSTNYSNSGQNLQEPCPAQANGISLAPTASFGGVPITGFNPGSTVPSTQQFTVTSNTNWTIGLSGTYASLFTLSTSAGGAGTTTITVTYNGSPSWGATVSIKLNAGGSLFSTDIVYPT